MLEVSIPDRSGRFIKIVQTGSVEGLFWSIHELEITATANEERLAAAQKKLQEFSKN